MLILRPDTVTAITIEVTRLPELQPVTQSDVSKIAEAARRCEILGRVASLAQQVLEEQGFVQVRGLSPETSARIFPAFATLLGNIYIDPDVGAAIIPAHVRPGELLMGNHLRRLPLHTDHSMMEEPPRLTMSCCLHPDALEEFGRLSIANIESACFGLYDDPEMIRLRTVPLPFAAQNARELANVIDRPILSQKANGRLLVRYHRSRIEQGFRVRKVRPSLEQLAAMKCFERLASECVQWLRVTAGDITVIDNHRTVHGRERCSVEVNADGTTTGRQMLFLFAY